MDERAEVTLKLSVDQARAVASALDFMTRLGIGQLDRLSDLVEDKVVIPYAERGQPVPRVTAKICREVDDLGRKLKLALGYPSNGSYGIGHPNVALATRRIHEINKALEQALAFHADPTPAFRGVNYDGNIVRYTDDPEPMVVVAPANTATG